MPFIDFCVRRRWWLLIIGSLIFPYFGWLLVIFSIVGFFNKPKYKNILLLPPGFPYPKDVNADKFTKCTVCKSSEISFEDERKKVANCTVCKCKYKKNGEKYTLVLNKKTKEKYQSEHINQNLPIIEWNYIAHHSKTLREYYIERLKKGNFPEIILQGVDLTGLKDGEKAIYAESTNLSEPRAIRQTVGVYGKGLYMSQSESHPEMRNICDGVLIMTNKRIIFRSNLRTSNIELKKILGMTAYSDGLLINIENKVRPQFFSVEDSELWGAFITGISENNTKSKPL